MSAQAGERHQDRVVRKLAKTVSQPVPGRENRLPPNTRKWATVTSVLTGGLLNLYMDGGDVPGVSYLASYTSPAVGDTVIVEMAGTDPLVIGTLHT